MKMQLAVFCGALFISVAAHAADLSWSSCESPAKPIDDARKDNPNSNQQSQINRLSADCLQKYGCPDSEKIRNRRILIATKDGSVSLCQALLADVKYACRQ